MKSEHRHDLKTNELGRVIERTKPFLDRYSNYLLIGLGVIVLIVVVAYFRSISTSSGELAWGGILQAETAEHYATIADDYPKSQAAGWARLREAESHLSNGIRLTFSDRDGALSDLKKAREEFEQVVENESLPADIRVRAQFGLARTLEVLSDGTNEDAIAAYEKVRRDFDDSVYSYLADQRITQLGKAESKEFYAWFHKQHPKPADRKQPNDGRSMEEFFGPGKKASDDTLNPSEDLDLPGLPAPNAPESKGEPESKNAPEFPESDAPKEPAKDAASENKSAPDAPQTPAATEQPAGEDPPAKQPDDKKSEKAPTPPAEKPGGSDQPQ